MCSEVGGGCACVCSEVYRSCEVGGVCLCVVRWWGCVCSEVGGGLCMCVMRWVPVGVVSSV